MDLCAIFTLAAEVTEVVLPVVEVLSPDEPFAFI